MNNELLLQKVTDIQGALLSFQELVLRRFEKIDERFDVVDKRFDAIDLRFDAVEATLASHTNELEILHTYIAGHDLELAEINEKLDTLMDLPKRVTVLEEKVARHGRMLRKAL